MSSAETEIGLAARRFSALLDRYLPDLLLNLSLTGSAADGDFQPGRSDLDFVAVMAHVPSDDELEGLHIVHRLYGADPTLATLDGIWLVESDLAAGPDAARPGPATESGEFRIEATGNRNPVTWFDLRDRSRPILGDLSRERIWHDPGRLLAWTRENVDAYWRPWLTQSSRLTAPRGLAMLGSYAPAWGVLGISRMHFTLATGDVASKSAAGEYALEGFAPHWRQIIEESLRIRRGRPGSLYRSPFRRRRDALNYVAMTIDAIRAGQFASE